jgi:hypothetical protein
VSFTVVIREPHTPPKVQRVDLSARAIISCGSLTDSEDDAEANWSVVGTAETWRRLLDGSLNVSAALRCNALRYCDYGENDFFVTEARISLLVALLGVPGLADSPALEPLPALAQ